LILAASRQSAAGKKIDPSSRGIHEGDADGARAKASASSEFDAMAQHFSL
jgi:hypothetical protein